MNKYKEAWDTIFNEILAMPSDITSEEEQLLWKCMDTVEELIAKEDLKPVTAATAYSYKKAFSCPVCNKRWSVSNSKKYIYCPHCGQKLDWSVKYDR